jgi:beta-1,4-mannosyltransferase
MKILFAPDYREGAPYQRQLANALAEQGVEVEFLSDYRRGLPLWRGTRDIEAAAIHLHWPEKYFQRRNDAFDRFRVRRYPLDLRLAVRTKPLFLTMHNLLPHNRGDEPGVFENIRATVRLARAVFVHSEHAGRVLGDTFGVADDKWRVIPHGEQSVALPPPRPRAEARSSLGLSPTDKICLVFGTVSPYKGTDELLRWWSQNQPACRLVVVGRVLHRAYADALESLAGSSPQIELRLDENWLSDEQLCRWLRAADCTVFNYRTVYTSGAAALALLIPRRLETIDLGEPHSHVLRFDRLETDFARRLEEALLTEPRFEIAREWREATSWSNVARLTAEIYRQVLDRC